ncbi:hypothetical protein [Zongyangia hominis]|uniref:hypothetical protein n=1 Tax=Zongyangia hominis TaxID=2763677 RepID=UPI0021CC9D58|nr:hypothetical protein [Zongyangia hominis]
MSLMMAFLPHPIVLVFPEFYPFMTPLLGKEKNALAFALSSPYSASHVNLRLQAEKNPAKFAGFFENSIYFTKTAIALTAIVTTTKMIATILVMRLSIAS